MNGGQGFSLSPVSYYTSMIGTERGVCNRLPTHTHMMIPHMVALQHTGPIRTPSKNRACSDPSRQPPGHYPTATLTVPSTPPLYPPHLPFSLCLSPTRCTPQSISQSESDGLTHPNVAPRSAHRIRLRATLQTARGVWCYRDLPSCSPPVPSVIAGLGDVR